MKSVESRKAGRPCGLSAFQYVENYFNRAVVKNGPVSGLNCLQF
jgi:hypothetical protein